MPISERKKQTNRKWIAKNKAVLGCSVYRRDAEEFKRVAESRGRTVNDMLREYVAHVLGRPLTRRIQGSGEARRDAGEREEEDL